MKQSGAQAIISGLERLGVERVFGIPGIQTIELFDALADAAFDTVVTTDERSAAFMADAHARVTGKLGVLIVVPGPGLTNALTGLAEAFCDSSPVLVIVPGPDPALARAFRLHDVDQVALLRPVVKSVFCIDGLGTIPEVLHKAATTALQGEQGPVALVIPQNLFMETDRFEMSADSSCPLQVAPPDPVMLDQIAEELCASPSVAIYAGHGASAAADSLCRLAEMLQASVATTISGRGVIPEDHPLSVGFGFGPAGTAAAWRALRRARTLLSIGCKFSEPATGSFGGRTPRRHLHIDLNSQSIGRNYKTDLALVADARLALDGLIQRLPGRVRQPLLADFGNAARARLLQPVAPLSPDSVTPAYLLQTLRRSLKRDAIVTTDSGNHQFWALEAFPVFAANTFLAPADFQAMGFSIPAAIAARLAHPQQQVVSIVGDGGFLLSAAELATAQRLSVKIIVLIFRDGALGLIREAQRQVHRRTPFTEVPDADIAMIAQAFGMEYIRIDCDEQVPRRLTAALDSPRAAIVDARVRYAKPSRYFRGAAQAMFAQMPWDRKARLALRRTWRDIQGFSRTL